MGKIKEHLKENWKTYVGVGVGVIIGGARCYILTKPGGISNVLIGNSSPTIYNGPVNTTINTLGGYQQKIVRCLETGQIWESVKAAAEEIGYSSPALSKHLNGHKASVGGLHYEILALGTKP